MTLEIIFFRKKQVLLNFAFFLFVDLLPNFNNESSHNLLSVFNECAMEPILWAKVWLYGFKSVFLASFN